MGPLECPRCPICASESRYRCQINRKALYVCLGDGCGVQFSITAALTATRNTPAREPAERLKQNILPVRPAPGVFGIPRNVVKAVASCDNSANKKGVSAGGGTPLFDFGKRAGGTASNP